MQSKYAHAYLTGLQKNADLSGFLSGAGDVVKAAPGFLFHAVADPAVGMVRDNFRTMGNIGDAYGKLFQGDMGGARSSMLKGVNSAGSALGNTALTGLNVVGAIGSLPFGEAPEAGLLALETGAKAGGLSAIKSLLAKGFNAVKQPIANTVSSAASATSRAIGPAATGSIKGVNQAFWPWFSGGVSSSGLSHAGQIVQGLTRATQPLANVAERLGIRGASSGYAAAGDSLANRITLNLPKSYSSLPWYKGGPSAIPLAQMGGDTAYGMIPGNALMQDIAPMRDIAPREAAPLFNSLKKIGPESLLIGAVPLAAAGIGGVGLYNSMHSPKKKDGDSDVIK